MECVSHTGQECHERYINWAQTETKRVIFREGTDATRTEVGAARAVAHEHVTRFIREQIIVGADPDYQYSSALLHNRSVQGCRVLLDLYPYQQSCWQSSFRTQVGRHRRT